MDGMRIKAPPGWVMSLRPPSLVRLRLFCFPHVGGGAAPFARWVDKVPPDVQVCPVLLPGREVRFGEPMPESLTALVEAIAANIQFGDKPFVFFGHSMGGAVAFELARLLRRQGRTAPVLLIASSARAPQLGHRTLRLHSLHGEKLAEELRVYGTPEEVLANQELMELFIPVIQTDSRLLYEHQYFPETPLPLPIVSYVAEDDPTVLLESVGGWREQTSARFTLRTFSGGHHYLHPGSKVFYSALAEDLGSAMAGSGPG